jgi:hypothetical protein
VGDAVSRFRITVRGTDIELRGYIDGEATLRVTAKVMEGIGLVVASPAEDDYNPFQITQPEHPPTIEGSREVIIRMMEGTDAAGFIDRVAEVHFAQANVIRGERYQREQAEAELRDRELHHFEVEQENVRLTAELAIRRVDLGALIDSARTTPGNRGRHHPWSELRGPR